MADDVTLPGTGDVVAADEISGKKHQRVKVQFGVDGSATDVSSSAPLPVIQTGTAPLPTGAATEATLADVAGRFPAGPGRLDGGASFAVAPDNQTFALYTSIDTRLSALETAAADDTPIGAFGPIQYVDVTLSLDTSAYASGDLLADAQLVAACVRANDVPGVLHSILVIDEDDQGAALDLYFASASSTFGTENSAPSISDANARTLLGFVSVATADYKDLGGVKVAFKSNVGMTVVPATGTDDVYVAAINGTGTPTYTASGLKLRLGFLS